MHNVRAAARLSGDVVDGGGGVGVERAGSDQGQEGAQCQRHTEPLHGGGGGGDDGGEEVIV